MYRQIGIGFKKTLKIFDKIFDEISWKKCGIIAYKDVIYESSKMYIDSIFLQLALAKVLRRKGIIAIPIINDDHEFIQREYYNMLINFLIKNDFFPFYFGGETRIPETIASFPHITLSISWIEKNREKVAKIVESLCLVQRTIDPEDIDTESLESLGEFFVKALGPPSLSEQLKEEFISDKLRLTLDAIGAASAFLNPYALIGTTVKTLWRTIGVILKRRSAELKAKFEEWTKNLQNFFSKKKLQKILSDEFPEEVLEKIISNNIAIISDAVRTPYEVFLVMLVEQLTEALREYSEEAPILFITDLSHSLLRSEYFRKLLLGENLNVVSYIQTDGLALKEEYMSFVERFMKEKAIIFNIAAEYFEKAIKGLPYSMKAMLLQFFAKIETTKKALAFVHYDAKKGWNFEKIREPLLWYWL